VFPFVVGGLQKHTYHLARSLLNSGVCLDLYFPQTDKCTSETLRALFKGQDKQLELEGIDWPKRGRMPGHYIRESRLYSQRVADRLIPKASCNGFPDFLYCKGFTGWDLMCRKKRGSFLPPIGVNFHGYEMFQKAASLKSWAEQLIFRRPVLENLGLADYVYSYGGRITELLLSLNVSRDRIIEIPGGVEKDFLGSSNPGARQGPRRFIFLGRYERRKGYPELIACLEMLLRDRSIAFEFHFVGPIPARKQLRNSAVIYHGAITDRAELQALVQSCDVMVAPSWAEGMPNVLLEGAACGLALIATDVGANALLVSSRTGWLIQAGNKNQLLSVLREACLATREHLNQMQVCAQELVRKCFTWEQVGQSNVAAIRARVSGGGQRARPVSS
jgi:glycosyltransferase involved in cell wall biosynthesis